jgi:hypothetical protein
MFSDILLQLKILWPRTMWRSHLQSLKGRHVGIIDDW